MNYLTQREMCSNAYSFLSLGNDDGLGHLFIPVILVLRNKKRKNHLLVIVIDLSCQDAHTNAEVSLISVTTGIVPTKNVKSYRHIL